MAGWKSARKGARPNLLSRGVLLAFKKNLQHVKGMATQCKCVTFIKSILAAVPRHPLCPLVWLLWKLWKHQAGAWHQANCFCHPGHKDSGIQDGLCTHIAAGFWCCSANFLVCSTGQIYSTSLIISFLLCKMGCENPYFIDNWED